MLIVSFAITNFIFISCTSNVNSNDSIIDIEWDKKLMPEYEFSDYSASPIGIILRAKFWVTKGSGELNITAEVLENDNSLKSTIYSVENSHKYEVNIPIELSGIAYCNPDSLYEKIKIIGGPGRKLFYSFQCEPHGKMRKEFEIGDISINLID